MGSLSQRGPPVIGDTLTMPGSVSRRKGEHLLLAASEAMQLRRNYFEHYVFEHNALPDLDLDEIDTSVEFLGRRLSAPLVISGMTGGTEDAWRINRTLAEAAAARGLALGVGSQRAAIEDPSTAWTFQVRHVAPECPLLANLGAVQLNCGYGIKECHEAVEMIGADALVLHMNVLQEALQPEGQSNFRGLLSRMGQVARELGVPVIAKEVGNGVSAATGRALAEQGITTVDVAGSGGTSWARIEGRRSGEVGTGEVFADWGIPTPVAIRQLSSVPGLTVIGSGGVRSGVDVAKAIALGSSMVGMAHPFLRAAQESLEHVLEFIDRTVNELRITMLCVGAVDIESLRQRSLAIRGPGGIRPLE